MNNRRAAWPATRTKGGPLKVAAISTSLMSPVLFVSRSMSLLTSRKRKCARLLLPRYVSREGEFSSRARNAAPAIGTVRRATGARDGNNAARPHRAAFVFPLVPDKFPALIAPRYINIPPNARFIARNRAAPGVPATIPSELRGPRFECLFSRAPGLPSTPGKTHNGDKIREISVDILLIPLINGID